MIKRLFALILILGNVLGICAEELPQVSDNSNEYWYYLKFTQGNYVVASDGDGIVCKSAIPTGKHSQLWKVVGNATSGYTLTNRLGMTLYAAATTQGSEIRAAATPGSLSLFKFNKTGSNYTISPATNTSQSLNCWGGMGFGNDIKLYDSSDANAPMTFIAEKDMNPYEQIFPIIPYPASAYPTYCGELDMKKVESITYFNDSTKTLAQQFANDLSCTAGITLTLTFEANADVETNDEHPMIVMLRDASMKSEAYYLEVCSGGVTVKANDYGGFFNAMQTLRQLLPAAIYGREKQEDLDWTCTSAAITDEPKLKYRGFHFDVSRHFFDKDEIKKLLDVASIYKLNRFHWHLTDDQGWRIEIPEYPKLTTVGAVRKRSLTINDPTNGTEFYDDTEYGRGMYYTLDDLREIVAYAKERNIEIIPEIDMPGHMVAAIAAYPELSCDPSREYEVRAAKGISTEVLNVGKDEVIDFLKCVLGHIAEVFPYEYIHIGGDECPTTAWQNNAECLQRVTDEGLSGVGQLQSWLVEQIGTFLRDEYGKRVVVWDELLSNWNSKFTIQPLVMCYRGMQYTSQAADKGFQSIAVPSYPMYFDLLQMKPDKLEINSPYYGGYGDGSVNTVENVYNFNPLSNVSGRENYVLGTQAALWTESCPTNEAAEYCLYPRLLALSETGWLPTSKKDFSSFYQRLQHHAKILDAKQIFYAPHYIETPDLTPAETALKEAETLVEASVPGAVGHVSQEVCDELTDAINALKADLNNASALNTLQTKINAFKTAPIVLPQEGKTYKIVSASTYFRNHYEGSVLYADGNELKIHYTEQTEPEELWEFLPQADGTYKMLNTLNHLQVTMQSKANGSVAFGKTGSKISIRHASKPAGGFSCIPGVVNIKTGKYNLYAQISGVTVTNLDSALCYPGTWRIIEVIDYTTRVQGLLNKAQHIIETSNGSRVGDPTVSALEFLRKNVYEAAQAFLNKGNVSLEEYNELAEKYMEFLNMPRVSMLDAIDENYYYQLQNAYFTDYYACGNSSNNCIEPKNMSTSDGMKWSMKKQSDGTIYIENKLTKTCAYVASNAAEQKLLLGKNYKWSLREVTTDQGNAAIAVVDGSNTYSWYTNPSAWNYVLLKPYDWGASVWNFVKTNDAVPTGISPIVETNTEASAAYYDLQGRPVSNIQNKGVYIKNKKKILK